MEFKAKDRRLEGDTPLRQCQLVQVYILDVLDEICARHNLRYFIDFGTLLGAYRHNGFIPWDDDLDITMPWPDYCQFVNICKAELPNNLIIDDPDKIPGLYIPTLRIRDRYSFFGELEMKIKRPCGISVDVFPLVKVPNLSRKWLFWFSWKLVVSLSSERIHLQSAHLNPIEMMFASAKALVWCIIFHIIKMVYYSLRLFKGSVWQHKPGHATEAIAATDDDLFPLAKHVFEGREYYVPRRAEKILEMEFGNWRELPPEEKRQGHHTNFIFPTLAPLMADWALPYPNTK